MESIDLQAYDWQSISKMLTEDALLLRLQSNEHDFVERKPLKQRGEWRQVAVAFANSAPVGWPAVLFVGVSDSGVPQCKTPEEAAKLIRSISDTLENVYPAIYRHVVPLSVPGQGVCVAVVVPGSPMRPHFAGHSYIRVGDQTKIASAAQYDALIATHNSKVRAVMEWVDKEITWTDILPATPNGIVLREVPAQETFVVQSCNPHYITVRSKISPGASWAVRSYRLSSLELGFDHVAKRLRVYCYSTR